MKNNFKKIVSIVLTMLMLVGTMTMLLPITAGAEEAQPIYLEKNTTAVINGITYRFDSDPSINPDSWARVNPDGTWELSYRSGDILWFPDVELTSDSKIRMDVTNTASVAQEKIMAGLAYSVTKTASGRADEMVVVITHTGGRAKIANSNYTSNSTPIPGDGFNGHGGSGDKIILWDSNYSTWGNNAAWTDVVNGNKCLASGKTVTYGVQKNDDGTTAVSYGAHYSNFFTYDVSASTYAFEGGAVGYTAVYSYNDSYAQTKISDLSVKNCKVKGEKVAGFSIFGEVIAPNTNVEVDGNVYRFDPLASGTESICVLKPDGTFRLTLQSGDLFWMPETSSIAGAYMSAKMITNNNQYNNGNLAAGLAYDIDFGSNNVWGDDEDSLITAHTQTAWRRRICICTVANRDTDYFTNLGVQSGYTMSSSDRNAEYLAWGNRWSCGNVLNYSLSINDTGYCYASFMNESGVEMTSDYYAIDESARKVLDGPIGFYSFWSGDGKENGYMTVEILDLYPIVDKPEVSDTQVSLSLDGTIGLNFAFNAKNFENATIVATKSEKKIAEQPVVDGANLMSVPVAAKEMGDNVNFSIMVDGELFENHSYTTNVATYAAELKKNADWEELMDAMLKYGAAAQMLLNYKTDTLVASLDGIAYDFSSFEAVTYSGDKSILTGVYTNLSLESDTTLKLYFKPAEGVELNVTVNGETAVLEENGDGYYVLAIDGIAADKLGTDFAIVVNGKLSFAVNALDWAKMASQNADVNVANVAKALAAYGDAAEKKA